MRLRCPSPHRSGPRRCDAASYPSPKRPRLQRVAPVSVEALSARHATGDERAPGRAAAVDARPLVTTPAARLGVRRPAAGPTGRAGVCVRQGYRRRQPGRGLPLYRRGAGPGRLCVRRRRGYGDGRRGGIGRPKPGRRPSDGPRWSADRTSAVCTCAHALHPRCAFARVTRALDWSADHRGPKATVAISKPGSLRRPQGPA